MLMLDFKARLKNINWWIGVISTLILIGKYFNFDITDYIGKDWQTLVGLIFGLLALLGVTVDTSTKGINDNIIQNSTVQAINKQEEVKAEASTMALNNKVTENSKSASTSNLDASAKIAVDNPENVIEDGQEVKPITATSPTT